MKICLYVGLAFLWVVGCTNLNKSAYAGDGKATTVLSVPFRESVDSLYLERVFKPAELFGEEVRIAYLPQHGSCQAVLVLTGMSPENYVVRACTLDGQNQLRDSLFLYSREPIRDQVDIRQTFEITAAYQFKVSKHLNDLLIEQLYYVIDDNGIFQEQRDGNTPAVAYESWDGIHYQVDSFIWDYNTNGGLYMKDKQTVLYVLEPDGTITLQSGFPESVPDPLPEKE